MSAKNVISIAICLILLGFLGACDSGRSTPTPFQGTDITGVDWGKGFSLTDHHGQRRTLDDFRGKVVALFFGFTHCPDVCPTTMGELSAALKTLGPQATEVQVVFITLDPARDTQAVLAKYVPAFNPGFLGLTGTETEVATVAKSFKVFYQKQETGSKAGYTLDHSANTFVFDKQGQLRLLYGFGKGAAPIVNDIKVLLN